MYTPIRVGTNGGFFLNRDVLNVTRCVVFSIIQDGGSGDSKGKSKHSKTNKNTVFKEKKIKRTQNFPTFCLAQWKTNSLKWNNDELTFNKRNAAWTTSNDL